MGKKEKSSKRKNRETGVGSEVLLQKSIGDKDGLDAIDDLNEPTMGEKLASLKLEGKDDVPNPENADSSLVVKPPSADSVNILVKQALHADDRALLIDCLYRQDEKVIANSLSMLNPSDVLKFLKSLVPIIQLRGAVLACALPWLRSLLLQHSSSIMSQESSLAALNTLYQIIESRVSTFNPALQLSSCLDLLYAESVYDEVEENDVIAPVIYEDEDDSDEDESDADSSMEVDTVEDGEEPILYSDISDAEEDGSD
ncbi:WD repeat-containing protein 43-like [Salvia hispanica]|uniref:WD repeat-containing protein 43-like n=1 Tax=Salvia hispanica TaxID=49212 RepID=UPI002009A5A4|nr:WD repeat-containing protein 43-like [Salvia hispanica]XP_047958618.1 WD repeat-containing protein 43-like [Salvia hispanica]XP_047958619.1 WD repeat-containing protein 43-like [Salvia hispanica]